MTSTVLETDVVELLDFVPSIPCEGADHSRGISGHIMEEPGAYMVISPCCGPKVIQCAPRVRYMHESGDLFCCSCATHHPTTDYTFIPLDTL